MQEIFRLNALKHFKYFVTRTTIIYSSICSRQHSNEKAPRQSRSFLARLQLTSCRKRFASWRQLLDANHAKKVSEWYGIYGIIAHCREWNMWYVYLLLRYAYCRCFWVNVISSMRPWRLFISRTTRRTVVYAG